MARRRGFFAEIQHQNRVAEQRQRAAARQQAAAVRQYEQAQRAEQRAILSLQRASEAERKQFEKEAAAAHVAAMQAEVEQLNSALTDAYERVDTLLAATLQVDDYVDLESLRRTVEYPFFDRQDLHELTPRPPVLLDPVEPVFQAPPAPTGLFGRKKKLLELQMQAEEAFGRAHFQWEQEMRRIPDLRRKNEEQYAAMEQLRQRALNDAISRHKAECARRDQEVADHNASVDQLITDLSYGVVDAVQEYIGIVLANSVYPEDFSVDYDPKYDPDTAELSLRVLIPTPETVPAIKSYRYVKASDEIVPVALSQKDAKDRYAGVVHQVALRTLHEVFEADRRGLVQSIALEVGVETVNPATGRETYIPFVAVGAPRDSFTELELSAVVPLATLEHLGAAVSKNPLGLVPVNGSGVRRSS
ncbi:hypothetical protein [Arthrobacter sp. Ld5]|uniref:hypothetical protein n=1 Tax=Arthrobacter sp. Ld5 TaxID=649152 RepID=UPI003EBE9369